MERKAFHLRPAEPGFVSPFVKKRPPNESRLAQMERAAVQKANGYDFRKRKPHKSIPQGNAVEQACRKVAKAVCSGGLSPSLQVALEKAERTLAKRKQ